ncbi:unnamed protein product, partial [Pelagomonas calceolata]
AAGGVAPTGRARRRHLVARLRRAVHRGSAEDNNIALSSSRAQTQATANNCMWTTIANKTLPMLQHGPAPPSPRLLL